MPRKELTVKEVIGYARRNFACSEGLRRFKRRTGTVKERFAKMWAANMGTAAGVAADSDLGWLQSCAYRDFHYGRKSMRPIAGRILMALQLSRGQR